MLGELRDELISSIQDNLSVIAEDYPIQKIGTVYEEVAGWSQALGICNLLLYADSDRFFENLLRSGQTRRAFLSKCNAHGVTTDYQQAISRWESFFDVVAADDLDIAQQIVTFSPKEWITDGEYEEDFCYYLFFHTIVAAPASPDHASLKGILDRFARALQGAASLRFDICQSFYTGDPDQFGDAFNRLLLERQAEMERDSQTGLADDMTFAPRSQVFVEGLALLRMAERAGFEVEADYLFCPSLGRKPRLRPPPVDVYEEIDRSNASKAWP